MTTRWLNVLFSTRPELRPARALLSPTWLGALAVLGLNDHLFKGAGVLPGGLTGKLSDVAGMIVAPVLLAALLGVQSRRGLLLCHIAVGLVFSLINLSPACADAWSWLMGLVGFPWAITVDPTDLLTLPALALGWRALVPAMRERAAESPVPMFRRPRPAEAGAAALGTLLCVATSRGDEGGEWGDEGWLPPPDTGWDTGDSGWYEPITADVYLHNSSGEQTISVRVRELRPDVQIDCFNVESEPGVLFSEPLFGEGVTWTLPPLTNVPARQIGITPERQCYAIEVSSDTLDPTILFWKAGDLGINTIDGQHPGSEAYFPGAVVLAVDPDGTTSITESLADIHYPRTAPAENAVFPGSDAARVAWSAPPSGVHQITELELGGDGCAAFTFDGGAEPRFYLCTPLTELPFAVDQWVDVIDLGDTLSLRLTPAPGDPTPVPDVQLAVSRGQFLPNFADFNIAAKPMFVDKLGPDPICGTVAQPQEISLDFAGTVSELAAGESVTLDDGAFTLTLHAVHAERRIILDPDCAEGPDVLGDDLEIAAVWAPTPPPMP